MITTLAWIARYEGMIFDFGCVGWTGSLGIACFSGIYYLRETHLSEPDDGWVKQTT